MELFRSEKFEARVKALLAKRHIPGMAIALVDDQEVRSAAYGLARLYPPQPCTVDSIFDIASTSKSMTGGSVALMVEDEEYPDVRWDAKMSELMPGEFVMSDENYTREVMVDDVISHRTGIASHDVSYFGPRSNQVDDAQSVTRNLRNLEVEAPIRTKHIYSNIMFTVATYLIEQKAGVSFADYLDSRFFGPLSMESSNLQPERARARGLGDRIAYGYHWDATNGKYIEIPPLDAPEANGAGSIMTTANDYIKWVEALIHCREPVSKAVYEGMVRQRSFENPDFEKLEPFTSPLAYGAGVSTCYYRGHLVVSHGGGVCGFGSYHFLMPGLKFGGVLFSNTLEGAEACVVLAEELMDEAIGVPVAERPNWEALDEERRAEDDLDKQAAELREELLAGQDAQPQTRILGDYVGRYRNKGYRHVDVEIKDGQLFIDATDRAFGFSLWLEHLADQTTYLARYILADELGGEELPPIKAIFEVNGEIVSRLGLDLDEGLEMIWFDRAE